METTKAITESMCTCAGKGRHEGMQYDRHTAATDQVAQSPSAHHRLLLQHYAALDTAQSDTPFQAVSRGAVPRQPGSMAPVSAHQVPAILPSPQPINAYQQQQQRHCQLTTKQHNVCQRQD